MNTDDLAPLFESRETRLGRLPEEARAKLTTAAESARATGQADFEDQQFVSLWLSRRTGLPRKDVLANFGNIAGRYFGEGATAAKAYDTISSYYKQTGTEAPVMETENPEAFAGTEGLAKVGKGALLVNVDQSARSAYGGFTGFSQKIPAGLFSQLATLGDTELRMKLKDPMQDPEFKELRTQTNRLEDAVYGNDTFRVDQVRTPGMLGFRRHTAKEVELLFGSGSSEEALQIELSKNRARMDEIRTKIDEDNRKVWKEWMESDKGKMTTDFRKAAQFYYEMSGEAMQKAGVNPEFQNTTLGQFMQSVGSVPATAALAAMGPVGVAGMESAFFADVESERAKIEGKAYDPQKALAANLASAGPQMVMERAFGVERLMANVLKEVPKTGGKVLFGDFAKQFVKRGLESGIEEGITEPAQNFWNDFIASQTYDEKRELLTEQAAKQRLIESVSAFTLGFLFAGGITTVEAVDTNRGVAKGERYLTTREGQPLTPADFNVLRQVKSDEQLLATAPDEATGRTLVAAANGDAQAQQAYNKRVIEEKFVNTDGLEAPGGIKLGMYDGVPAITRADTGVTMTLDMNDPEQRAYFDGLKQQAIAEQATKETLASLQQRFGESLRVERTALPISLRERVNSGLMTEAQANEALEVAKLVNGLAQTETLETAAVQGSASLEQVRDGVFQMVAKVAQAADPTVAIEEVAETYIKKAYADQNLKPAELDAVRQKWHADNGEADVASKLTGEARDRANVEWFSKRVIDYALANRKTELPGGWGKWLRTLGERLKTVLRGAAKMKKLLREGKLDADLETLMKGALGQVTPQQVRSQLDATKADAARKARLADLEAAFGPGADPQGQRANERVLRSYKGYEDLKAQLRAEEQTAALAALRSDREAEAKAERERDFIKAKLEEELQAVIDDRLNGPETITENGPLTDEEVFVAEMLNDAPVYDLTVQLSPQAERLLAKYEGETEQTLTEEARTLNASYRRADMGNREAAPTMSQLGEEAFQTIAEAEDFPTITGNADDGFTVKGPDGQEVGQAQDLEKARNMALKWYDDEFARQERAAVMDEIGWGADEEVQRAIIRRGGLLAPSQEPVFKGELKALAENLDAGQRMRLFRKSGKPLDYLIQYLREDGFNFETANDLLIALDRSTRGEPVFPQWKGETFSITRTEAFKKWFKDSKVVDEDGKPLVVYHGTTGDFSTFDPARLGQTTDADSARAGFFFSDSPATASNYANAFEGRKTGELKRKQAEAERKAQRSGKRADWDAADELSRQYEEAALAEGNNRDGANVMPVFLSIQNPHVYDFAGKAWEEDAFVRQIAVALAGGKDGVVFRNVKDDPVEKDRTGTVYVAFDPTQIKSAIGNRGTFDANNPNITFSIAPVGTVTTEPTTDAWGKSGSTEVVYREKGAGRATAVISKDGDIRLIDWSATPIAAIADKGIKAQDDFTGKGFGRRATLALLDEAQMRGVSTLSVVGPSNDTKAVLDHYMDTGLFSSTGENDLTGYPTKFAINYKVADQMRQGLGNAFSETGPTVTFATTGVPQNQAQANQAMMMRIQAKRLAAGASLLQQLNSGQPLPARAKAVRRSTEASLAAKLFVPLVSRLDAISNKANLGQRLRRLDYDINQAVRRDFEAVKPFLTAFEALGEKDAEVLNLALMNSDTVTRDAVLRANGMTAAFARVEQVLASTRARAVAAGYDVGEIQDYFPRKVNDVDGLMVHYYGQPQSGRIEEALREAAKTAQAQGRVLTREERIEVVNSVLRGFRGAESKPGNLKERRTDVVDVAASRFYADSTEALVTYVERLNQAIEKRRFFGKFAVPVAASPGAVSSQLALESSIGAYVEGLVATGDITRQQQAEVQSILEARFSTGVQSDFIRNIKTLSYITTMGHLTAALSQISDVAYSLYENGAWDTAVSYGQAAVKKSKITKEQLGLDAIAEEFRDPGKMAKLLNGTFRSVGIHYLDMVGKETLVNAKFRRMQREAAAGQLSPRSLMQIDRAFDPATAAQVKRDLAKGKKTENTLFAVYSVLADYQPLTQSEYPEYYLRHPNGRIFYMLKSFTLKQFDAFRREAITKIVSGNAGQKVEGFSNLAHLAGLLFLIGVPVDWLKDFVMGRRPVLEDIAVDNVFKLLGVNRWALWQFRENPDPVRAALMLAAPPAPFFVYPAMDVKEAAKRISEGEDIEPGKFESWRVLPFIGSPIYWLLGGGADKVAAKELRERGSSTPAR